jgi:hypothetical protein
MQSACDHDECTSVFSPPFTCHPFSRRYALTCASSAAPGVADVAPGVADVDIRRCIQQLDISSFTAFTKVPCVVADVNMRMLQALDTVPSGPRQQVCHMCHSRPSCSYSAAVVAVHVFANSMMSE